MFNLFVCWFLITVNDYIEMCVIFVYVRVSVLRFLTMEYQVSPYRVAKQTRMRFQLVRRTNNKH